MQIWNNTPLLRFVRESNKIEGILREPTYDEVKAHYYFLRAPVTVKQLEHLVSVLQPNAKLRRRHGVNVRVGQHVSPPRRTANRRGPPRPNSANTLQVSQVHPRQMPLCGSPTL